MFDDLNIIETREEISKVVMSQKVEIKDLARTK